MNLHMCFAFRSLSYCWQVKTPSSHTGLHIQVMEFDFAAAGCDNNRVMVYDGKSPHDCLYRLLFKGQWDV